VKIKAFIAEDEPHSLDRLKDLLGNFSELDIIGEARDGLKAIELIDEMKPELVFLDIKMPGASGFEVLEKIRHDPMVIFVTAYDKYAIKAFDENAVDYILKPTSLERLSKAVKKARERNYRITDSDLARLKLSLKHEDHIRRFVIKKGDEIQIIPESEAYYFKASDKYVFLHTKERQFFFDMSLKELDKVLDPQKFCRIHKSFIVAIDKIKKLKKWFHGEYLVEMKDLSESALKVSRNYKDNLNKKLRL
jgi:DNA-binding LytR/AlgR family response regulator